MDYQNRAGSKKGGGGIASDSQTNVFRRKQVDELLRKGVEVPYTFEDDAKEDEEKENDAKLKRNPYIYKNHSGKLVCKLCNTMHMSWSSVERHLAGKKHGLNVIRRSRLDTAHVGKNNASLARELSERTQFQQDVEKEKENMRHNGIVPGCQVIHIKDNESELEGLCLQINYSKEKDNESEFPPFARIVSGLELATDDKRDKKYIVIAYEPFENVSVEIPNKELVFPNGDYKQESGIDEFNNKCTYWDEELKYFFIQFYFKSEKEEQVDDVTNES